MAKWTWVVKFQNGTSVDVPTARGARDANLQALWIDRQQTGVWPTSPIVETQKRPTSGNGLMYLSYRRKA